MEHGWGGGFLNLTQTMTHEFDLNPGHDQLLMQVNVTARFPGPIRVVANWTGPDGQFGQVVVEGLGIFLPIGGGNAAAKNSEHLDHPLGGHWRILVTAERGTNISYTFSWCTDGEAHNPPSIHDQDCTPAIQE
jgi:hypothetical protein